MTIKATIYRLDTGEIVGTSRASDLDLIEMNLGDGNGYAEGHYLADQYYFPDGVVTEFPPRPGDWAVFDYGSRIWIDPRDPVAELEAARASANMTRSDFLLAAIRAGIILPSDAGPAARGEIPPSLEPVFDGLPPEVQIEAVVRWSASTMIERMNPVLAALAGAMTITDAQLDALFGIHQTAE